MPARHQPKGLGQLVSRVVTREGPSLYLLPSHARSLSLGTMPNSSHV